LTRQVETLATKWRVAWEAKAVREFLSRLRQWGNYLNEVQRDPQEHAVYYRYEVRVRVIAELLRDQIGDYEGKDSDLTKKLDQRLRAQFMPGDFIWTEGLKGGFPKDGFWFLWGSITFN